MSHSTTWKEVMNSELNTDPYFKENRLIKNEQGRLQYVPNKQKGGFHTDINKRRQVLRDWVYGADIGMLQEANGGYLEADLTDEEIEQYRKGGYIVEDVSVPQLTQAQRGITISDPKEYAYRKGMYDDSLSLYNAYQFQKANYKPGYDAWLTDVGKDFTGGKEALKKAREKNLGKPLQKSYYTKTHKKSAYNDPSGDKNFDPLYPQEKFIIDKYKSIVKGNPNFRIGMHNSPDLWHKKIMPSGSYYAGAMNPIYKKPVQAIYKPGEEPTSDLESTNKESISLKTKPLQKINIESNLQNEVIPSTYSKPKKYNPTKTAYRSQTIMEQDPNRPGEYRMKESRQVPYATTKMYRKGDVWEDEYAPRVLWIDDEGNEVDVDPRKNNVAKSFLFRKGGLIQAQEGLQQPIIDKAQDEAETFAYAKAADRERWQELMDKSKALMDTAQGRKLWYQDLKPKNFSIDELQRFTKGVKEYNQGAQDYERARRKVQEGKIPTSDFARMYEERGWGKYDQATMKEGYQGQFQDAADEAQKRKEANMGVTDAVLELTGAPALSRIIQDPMGTLKGVGNTVADLALSANPGFGSVFGAGDPNVNPLTGNQYWSGLDKTLDVVGVLPGVGSLGKLGKLGKVGKVGSYAEDILGASKKITDAPKNILSDYRNIEELRLANKMKDYDVANKNFGTLFPDKQIFNQTKKEASALLNKYKPEFIKKFGKGTDEEVLLYGAHKDLGDLPTNQNFLTDDAFAQSTGLTNNLSNQNKFLSDAYQLEFSGYFNRNPQTGGNRQFSEYLSDQFEPVITANKLNKPVQVKRTSSFNRPVKTMREGNPQPFMSKYDELQEGDIIYPEHNWSTTSDIQGDVWGSGSPTSKVARINLPAGQSTLRPNMFKGTQYANEEELVLPSKLGYKVSGLNPQGFGDDNPRFIFDVVGSYKKGGYIDAELTPEEIDWYRSQGYQIEDID